MYVPPPEHLASALVNGDHAVRRGLGTDRHVAHVLRILATNKLVALVAAGGGYLFKDLSTKI